MRSKSDKQDWWVVAGLAVVWTLVVGWLAVQRHLALRTEFDVAVYSHIIWTTTQGRPFFNALVEGTTNYLVHHFVPLMLVYVPLYAARPDPSSLLTAQTAILAAGVFPLYRFARRRLSRWVALTVVLAYLLSPLLHFVALADLHEIALAVPLLMGAAVALIEGGTLSVLLWLGLALLTKEEVAVIAVWFGLYAMVIQRRWRFGALLAVGSVLWGMLLFRVIVPALGGTALHGGAGLPSLAADYGFLWRYRSLGDTPAEVVSTLVTQPAKVYGLLATPPKLEFTWQVLAPFAGLPVLGLPAFLLALAPMAYLLLSDYAFQFSIRYHYTAPIIPFLFVATVIALQRLRRWGRGAVGVGTLLLLTASLVTAARWSPLPGGGSYRPEEFRVTQDAQAARSLLATIPPEASVAADSYLQPWLANRWRLGDVDVLPFQQFPGEPPPSYLALRAAGPNAVGPPILPWLIPDSGSDPLRVPRYDPAKQAGGVELWQRRPPAEDVVMSRLDAPFERGLVLVAAGVPPEVARCSSPEDNAGTAESEKSLRSPAFLCVAAGKGPDGQETRTLPVWVAWRADQPLSRRITFSLHLVDEEGQLVAQADSEMAGGRFPTTLWHTWEERPTLADAFPLEIPADLPAGRYQLLGGAFETETVTALNRADGPEGRPWLPLATVVVGS